MRSVSPDSKRLRGVWGFVGLVLGAVLIEFGGKTVHIYEELVAFVDEGAGGLIAAGVDGETGAVVLGGVADDCGGAIGVVDDGTVGSTHDALGTSVLIPVEGSDVDFVALEVDHVWSAVDPPEFVASEVVGLDDVEGLEAGSLDGAAGMEVAVDELDDEFHLSVAIEVGYGGIVGFEGVG